MCHPSSPLAVAGAGIFIPIHQTIGAPASPYALRCIEMRVGTTKGRMCAGEESDAATRGLSLDLDPLR